MPGGDQAVLIGDFTGHGLPAAVGTPLVADACYSMTLAGDPVAAVLRAINAVLVRRLPRQLFMTVAAVCVPPGGYRCRVRAPGFSFHDPDR